jgi:hypothetical protein
MFWSICDRISAIDLRIVGPITGHNDSASASGPEAIDALIANYNVGASTSANEWSHCDRRLIASLMHQASLRVVQVQLEGRQLFIVCTKQQLPKLTLCTGSTALTGQTR